MKIGSVELQFLGHSGLLIANGKRIAIDPYNVSASVAPVDYILITHSHYDHCSIKDIQKLAKAGTVVVVTADAQSKLAHVKDIEPYLVEAGETLNFDDVKIDAVPAYNLTKEFHAKREGWVGYVVKMKDVVIYHAGDTDMIPEMKNLTGYGKQGNTFVALLPVSGTYVMDADEAAEAADLLKPGIALPIHYGAGVIGTVEDAQRFVSLCTERGIKAEILEKA